MAPLPQAAALLEVYLTSGTQSAQTINGDYQDIDLSALPIQLDRPSTTPTEVKYLAEAVEQALKNELNRFNGIFKAMKNMEDGWDSYDAEAPNDSAIKNARFFIKKLVDESIKVDSVLASVMGGVTLTFRIDTHSVTIEFYNDGKGIFAIENRADKNARPQIQTFSVSSSGFDYVIEVCNGFRVQMPADRMLTKYHDIKKDPNFSDSEELYFRFPPNYYEPPDSVNEAGIRPPDMSVNRSKYDGKPRDVLTSYRTLSDGTIEPFIHWGVAQFTAGNIPSAMIDPQIGFRSRIIHDPVPDNFYHSEIRMYNPKTGKRLRTRNPSETLAWRLALKRVLTVPIQPSKESEPRTELGDQD